MRHRMTAGLLAGAAGTTALNIAGYADMASRGRASSDLPERLVDRTGLKLGDGEAAGNRRQALGALLGYAVGLGVGVAYGLASRRSAGGHGARRVAAGAVALTAAAMLASDAPATALGLTDPRTWPAGAWPADLAPHLAYGIVTAVTYDRLTRRRRREIR